LAVKRGVKKREFAQKKFDKRKFKPIIDIVEIIIYLTGVCFPLETPFS